MNEKELEEAKICHVKSNYQGVKIKYFTLKQNFALMNVIIFLVYS